MKIKHILLLMVLLCSVSLSSAETISFIDPGLGSDSNTELLIYYGNGSFAGILTTNDSIYVDPDVDLVVHKRNVKMSVVDDPIGFLSWTIDTMGYTIIVIVAGVIIGVGVLSIAVQAAKGSKGWAFGPKRKW